MISGDEDADVILGGGGCRSSAGSRRNKGRDKGGRVTSCRESLQVCVLSPSWWKRRGRRNPETGLFLFLILLSSFILLSVLILGVVIYLFFYLVSPGLDPCDGIQCPSSQVCQMDDNRSPICRCNAICSAEVRPVCGSDGKTYSNECALRVEACKSRRSLRIIYSGDCATGAAQAYCPNHSPQSPSAPTK